MDEKRIIEEIVSFVKNYSREKSTETEWGQPLVGFASAEDPLFLKLREVVRPSHALPQDLLPSAQTVVAFFLPFKSELQKENAKAGLEPSRSWAVAYIETNRLIRDLSEHLKVLLESGLVSSRRDGLWIFYSALNNGEGREFIDSVKKFLNSN